MTKLNPSAEMCFSCRLAIRWLAASYAPDARLREGFKSHAISHAQFPQNSMANRGI